MVIIASIILICGIGFLITCIVLDSVIKSKNKKINTYSLVKGVITGSAYNGLAYNNGGNPNISFGISNAPNSPNYSHRVYDYEVDGVKYSKAESYSILKSQIEKELNTEVDVYYDPGNPDKSFIKSDNDSILTLKKVFFILSISLISLGILFNILGLLI